MVFCMYSVYTGVDHPFPVWYVKQYGILFLFFIYLIDFHELYNTYKQNTFKYIKIQ